MWITHCNIVFFGVLAYSAFVIIKKNEQLEFWSACGGKQPLRESS